MPKTKHRLIVENGAERPEPEFVKVIKVSRLGEGKMKRTIAHGKPMALLKTEGTFYAVNDICPGYGRLLSEGRIEGTKLVCPGDNWSYDVRTGKGPYRRSHRIATYAVRVEGDEVFVGWLKELR